MDKIVYFGDGFILGVFTADELCENVFDGWHKNYPYQVRTKPLPIPNNPIKQGIRCEQFKARLQILRMEGKSWNILQLTEAEFNQVLKGIEGNIKELSLM